jgi:hypothetical protein
VKRVVQSPLDETARAVGHCGKWRRGYQAPGSAERPIGVSAQRKAGRSACGQSVCAPATTEQSSIGRSLMTPHVYVAVFSSEKIDANEDAAIILDDVSEHVRNEFSMDRLEFLKPQNREMASRWGVTAITFFQLRPPRAHKKEGRHLIRRGMEG